LDAVLPHDLLIGTPQVFRERTATGFRGYPGALGSSDTARVDPGSTDYWEWFYEVANRGAGWSPDRRLRAIEERWHPNLVLIQSPEIPGTAGEFRGYQGLAAVNRELLESWEQIDWRPCEVHELGGGRYLVLLDTSGRARRSGILLEGGQIAHIVTVRDGRAERMEVYMSWEEGREAAGLG
jgi:hypothetical protein